MVIFQADKYSGTTMALKDITTRNPEPAPKRSENCEEKASLRFKKYLKQFKGNSKELNNLT